MPDFILNDGDSIHDASYAQVKREDVTAQWVIWDNCIETVKGIELYSCLGNRNPWWGAPANEDLMHGKDYVVQRLNIPEVLFIYERQLTFYDSGRK